MVLSGKGGMKVAVLHPPVTLSDRAYTTRYWQMYAINRASGGQVLLATAGP